jgi:hypothetical protein
MLFCSAERAGGHTGSVDVQILQFTTDQRAIFRPVPPGTVGERVR